ncbi:MAG TPA: hypothetical protein VMV44_14525 [Rectinemataceae bacterium]|nr:hypothetical protein [Rectinemataceae bacterium]
MGWFDGIVNAVKSVGAKVVSIGSAIVNNPLASTVASMVPGGSMVLGIAKTALNSPVVKALSSAVAAPVRPVAAPIVTPPPAVAPAPVAYSAPVVMSKTAAPLAAASGTWRVPYRDTTSKIEKVVKA